MVSVSNGTVMVLTKAHSYGIYSPGSLGHEKKIRLKKVKIDVKIDLIKYSVLEG
jgi:hypothetical protein